MLLYRLWANWEPRNVLHTIKRPPRVKPDLLEIFAIFFIGRIRLAYQIPPKLPCRIQNIPNWVSGANFGAYQTPRVGSGLLGNSRGSWTVPLIQWTRGVWTYAPIGLLNSYRAWLNLIWLDFLCPNPARATNRSFNWESGKLPNLPGKVSLCASKNVGKFAFDSLLFQVSRLHEKMDKSGVSSSFGCLNGLRLDICHENTANIAHLYPIPIRA